MQIARDARKCLVYLGFDKPGKPGEITPQGTGFFVDLGRTDGIYLVTAAHVARTLDDGPFAVRLNDKSGAGRNHAVERIHWYEHPLDPTVDVAVAKFDVPEWADAMPYPKIGFLTETKRGEKHINPGDLIYVVGIFSLVHGKKKNLPAVHVGHIALMPEDEPIPIRDWRESKDTTKTLDIRGYVVEASCLDGSSGSPVFVRRSLSTRVVENPATHQRSSIQLPYARTVNTVEANFYGSMWLLGVWRGTWLRELPHGIVGSKDAKMVPAGMGTVVPTPRLVEVLDFALADAKQMPVKSATTTGRRKSKG